MKTEPVLIVMSVLAGLQVLAGGAAFAQVVPQPWAGLVDLAVVAATVGFAFYVRGKVTPVEPADRTSRRY